MKCPYKRRRDEHQPFESIRCINLTEFLSNGRLLDTEIEMERFTHLFLITLGKGTFDDSSKLGLFLLRSDLQLISSKGKNQNQDLQRNF